MGSSSATILLTLLVVLGSLTSVLTLPSGFIDEGVVSREAIITGAFAPNPRNGNKPMLILSTKNGQIYVLEDPDNSEENFLIGDFGGNVCTNGERGLQSITVHPNFTENYSIYLFYSKAVFDCPESEIDGPPNRVSRFIMDPVTLQIDKLTEFVVMETSPAPKKIHNGGTMQFGVDGYLYITTGDGGMREPAYSQDLTNLFGSVLRVDENGFAPDTNPFKTAEGLVAVPCGKNGLGRPSVGSPEGAVCEEIYAFGLRNPFRLTMDPNSPDKVVYTIGDVGASVWEELSIGGDDYIGANYGWPFYEGPCEKGSFDDCLPGNPAFVEPYYYYLHTSLEEGGAVVGSAYVPNSIGWPDKYKFLFIDFIFNTTYNLVEVPGTECRDCRPPRPSYINETFYELPYMIDMFFGPYRDTQALYVISRNTGQSIRRIRYTGNNNTAPVALFTASTAVADINEVITFDARNSYDGDGDEITYFWEFGDGVTSDLALNEHAYTSYGTYTVKLTVNDTLGQSNQAQTVVNVGTPPTAFMISPANNSRFAVGFEMLLYGNATDASGAPLNDTQIAWEVRQHHADHYHPFLDRDVGIGNNFRLDPAPSPEDFLAADTSFLRVIMYATDSFGLVTTVVRDIYPKKVFITIDSEPRGMTVLVDEYPVITPRNITSWEAHNLHLDVEDQDGMTFSSWSFGDVESKSNFTVPARTLINPIVTVTFVPGNSTEPNITDYFPPIVFVPRAPATSPPTTLPTFTTTGAPVAVPVAQTEFPTKSSIVETDSPPTTAPVATSVSDGSIDLSNTSNTAGTLFRFYFVEGYMVLVLTFCFYIVM